MKDISPLHSSFQRPISSNAPGKQSGAGKVVVISSHPAWPAQHKFRGDDGGEGEIAADTVQLTRIFHEVLERVRQGPVLNMDDESVTIGQMIDQIWQRISMENAPIRLSRMLRLGRSERGVICTFLALLELVRLEAIVLRQDRKFSDILVRKNSALTG